MNKHFAIVDIEGPFITDLFYKVHFLENSIDKITSLVDNIEHLQTATLEPMPNTKTKDLLEGTMMEIRQLGNNVRKDLNEMKQLQEMESITHVKNVRHRIIEAHINVLTKRFCDIMDKYYGSVIAYREKCKIITTRQLQIAGIEKDDNKIEELLLNGHSISYPQIMIDIQQTQQALNHVEVRQFDIMKLEDSIRELHDMFIDLETLIKSQRTHVSSIEEYVKQANEYIERSQSVIRETEIQARSINKKKIYIIAMFITVAVICVVYLIRKAL